MRLPVAVNAVGKRCSAGFDALGHGARSYGKSVRSSCRLAFEHPAADEAAANLTAMGLQIPYLCHTDASHPVGTLLRAERDNDHRSTE